MVAATINRRLSRLSPLLIGAVLPFFALLGCDLLVATPTPPFLTYAETELNVDGKFPDPLRDVEAVPLTAGDTGYLALFGRAEFRKDYDTLLLMNDRFQPVVEQTDEPNGIQLDRSGVVTATGAILVGNLLFDPGENSVTNRASPERVIFAGAQVEDNFYTVQAADSNSVAIQEFNSAFVQLQPEPRQVGLAAEGNLGAAVHGHDYLSPEGTREVVLIAGVEGTLFVVTVPASELPGLEGPLFSTEAPESSSYPTVAIPGEFPEKVTKTRDGIITWNQRNEELRRYDAASGELLDSFVPGNDGEDFFERYEPRFFATGGNYLILDVEGRKLFGVAPWW